MTSKNEGGSLTTYTYDGENRLAQVSDGTATSAFTYNGEGLRVSKIHNGQSTQYVNDINTSLSVILQESSAGKASSYQYGLSLLAQVDSSDNPYFYHADGLGSVRAITDSSASQVATYSYEAFGELLSSSGTVDNPFRFSGQQQDETSLYYLRARYYLLPMHGRFMSRRYICHRK